MPNTALSHCICCTALFLCYSGVAGSHTAAANPALDIKEEVLGEKKSDAKPGKDSADVASPNGERVA